MNKNSPSAPSGGWPFKRVLIANRGEIALRILRTVQALGLEAVVVLVRRFGDVRDVADAVCYLAGPSGSFITGTVVTVDGGNEIWGDQWTIPRPDWFNADR